MDYGCLGSILSCLRNVQALHKWMCLADICQDFSTLVQLFLRIWDSENSVRLNSKSALLRYGANTGNLSTYISLSEFPVWFWHCLGRDHPPCPRGPSDSLEDYCQLAAFGEQAISISCLLIIYNHWKLIELAKMRELKYAEFLKIVQNLTAG